MSVCELKKRRQSIGREDALRVTLSMLELVGVRGVGAISMALTIGMMFSFVSGCSSIVRNSEGFYQKIPQRPTNWHEYLTD
jgi:hypothetical protein